MLETTACLIIAALLGYALRSSWMAWRLWQQERREEVPRGRWRLRH